MGKRLYCGNLPFSATADEVKAIFAEDGRTVTDVHIVTDRETGRSRGFAFVELASEQEAESALRAVDGRIFAGRPLAVKEARERAPRPGFGGPGGDRGFGGPRGPRPGGRPGFGGPRGPGPQVERRPSFGAPGGHDRGGFGGERGGYGRDGGFGRDRFHGNGNGDRGGYGGYGRDFPPEPIPEPEYAAPVEPDYSEMPEGGYGAPEDIDYRERGDRGKRGRDRRGGRRRGGDDYGDW